MSGAHEPTPWMVDGIGIIRTSECGVGIRLASPWIEDAWNGHAGAIANAEFIVRACNNFDSLVDALREALAVATRNEDGDFADRALDALLKAGADR
jgi:hypothetical protein